MLDPFWSILRGGFDGIVVFGLEVIWRSLKVISRSCTLVFTHCQYLAKMGSTKIFDILFLSMKYGQWWSFSMFTPFPTSVEPTKVRALGKMRTHFVYFIDILFLAMKYGQWWSLSMFRQFPTSVEPGRQSARFG